MQEQDLKLIFNAIKSGKCLAFLGAGACTAFRKPNGEDVPGLPTGKQLAQWLAQKCEYKNGTPDDLAKVAEHFLYTQNGDREPLEKAVKEKIQIRCLPRPIHTVISQLSQIEVIITSNYDTLLERELGDYGRRLTKHVHNPQNPRTGHYNGPRRRFLEKEIVLHKMHGSIDEPGSMVITESDYIRYLALLHDEDRGMPDFFRKTIIPESILVFLGYSLQDWNFRVIWEGMLSKQASVGTVKDAYALFKIPSSSPSSSLIHYWSKRNIEIIDCDLTDFSIKLAQHFKLDIPQLNIEKGVQQ